MQTRFLLAILVLAGCWAIAQEDSPALKELKAKEGFRKLLPRGKIAAIYKPEFVAGKDADMPGDAWIIGVTDGKAAKAYSINLLNKHEIVNDFIGDKPIATTW